MIYPEKKKGLQRKIKSKRWGWLLLCLIFNLGILAVIKYTNFALSNINSILTLFKMNEISYVNLLLPMGISFYTFQSMSYIIDVYREKYEPERNIGKMALFVSFFPQLIQGPISRFDDLSKTFIKNTASMPKPFPLAFKGYCGAISKDGHS